MYERGYWVARLLMILSVASNEGIPNFLELLTKGWSSVAMTSIRFKLKYKTVEFLVKTLNSYAQISNIQNTQQTIFREFLLS